MFHGNKINRSKRKPSDPGRWHWRALMVWMRKCKFLYESGSLTYNDYIAQTGLDMSPELEKKINSARFHEWLKMAN